MSIVCIKNYMNQGYRITSSSHHHHNPKTLTFTVLQYHMHGVTFLHSTEKVMFYCDGIIMLKFLNSRFALNSYLYNLQLVPRIWIQCGPT